MSENTQESNNIAIAIVAGFTLVAAAIYFSNTQVRPMAEQVVGAPPPNELAADIDPRRGDESLRNIYGNPDAPVTIVEFSDYDCPFCARLHPTLKTIVDESDGQISWEYRHLPLPSHPDAFPAAVAAECVRDNVSPEAFWTYGDWVLDNQGGLTAEALKTEALAQGIAADVYDGCIVDEAMITRVEDDVAFAQSIGAGGTPFSVVRFEDGSQQAVSGALPLFQWQQLLEQG